MRLGSRGEGVGIDLDAVAAGSPVEAVEVEMGSVEDQGERTRPSIGAVP